MTKHLPTLEPFYRIHTFPFRILAHVIIDQKKELSIFSLALLLQVLTNCIVLLSETWFVSGYLHPLLVIYFKVECNEYKYYQFWENPTIDCLDAIYSLLL